MSSIFSEKRRVPAWCDRILYWTRDKNVKIEQNAYTSSDSVTFSDHKPVISLFNLAVKKVDKNKRMKVYDELLKETDRQANNLLPQVALSRTEVSSHYFGVFNAWWINFCGWMLRWF
jgi:phosphatidylinositol-bisphosphatase